MLARTEVHCDKLGSYRTLPSPVVLSAPIPYEGRSDRTAVDGDELSEMIDAGDSCPIIYLLSLGVEIMFELQRSP